MIGLSWLLCGLGLAAETSPGGRAGSYSCGPTLQLSPSSGTSVGNPIADLMYFVALISPEPVSMVQNPGNAQRTRLISAKRRSTGNTFLVSCEFEVIGSGYQRNVFDHSEKIRQNERKLKEGAILDHQLGSINVEGSGTFNIEVEGVSVDGAPNVNSVRLHFDARGRPSPVTIDLHDLHYVRGVVQHFNETLAQVTSLTFRRQSGLAKMDISVASVRRKDAGDSTWESLKSKVKATAVNLIMDPIVVDPAGHEAMLQFGLALVSNAPAFTFPRAAHLKQ
jgi:hypothetical protein